jgi:hypothetical protein
MPALLRLPRSRFTQGQEHKATRSQSPLPALAAACVLSTLLAAGCGPTSVIGSGGSGASGPGGISSTGGTVTTSGPISLSVQHQTGTQGLTITLTVKNASQQPMIWDGGCVTPYTVFLRDAHNNLVQRWPPIQTGTRCNAIVVVTLQPGRSQTFAIVQTTDAHTASGGTIPAGTYTVNAQFTVNQYRGTGPLNFVANEQINW